MCFPSNPCGQARARFPSGLLQPEGSFRFSEAGLLPAAFITQSSKDCLLADLGAGCGAAGFAALLTRPELSLLAVEREPELCAALRINAETLGVAARTRLLEQDLEDPLPDATQSSCDLALANPPYRRQGQGRTPGAGLRRRALFEDGPQTLPAFCRAASFLLRHGGRFALIYPVTRLPELLTALGSTGLGTRRLRPVRPAPDRPAELILVEARKGAANDPVLERDLITGVGRRQDRGHIEEPKS